MYTHRRQLQDDLEAICRRSSRVGAVSAAQGTVRGLDTPGAGLWNPYATLDIASTAIGMPRPSTRFCPGAASQHGQQTFSERALRLLTRELAQRRPLIPTHLPFSPETNEVVQTFRTIAALLEQQ